MKKRNRAAGWLCILLCLMLLCACDRPGEVFSGFGKDELFRIDKASCSRSEFLVYLTTTQARYEDVYGVEVWNIARDDITLEDNVKDTVLARIAQVKTLCLLAQSKEISLDEAENALAKAAAAEYFGGLSEEALLQMPLEEKDVLAMYQEYALSEKVYQAIVSAINPEISDDEARSVLVQRILFRTYTTDGSGSRVEYSDVLKNDVFDKAADVLQKALAGEDFKELAETYSETDETEISFGKGEEDEALERAAFRLETGEISAVIETSDGYQIIKCLSTFDREQTANNKAVLLEKRRREAFVGEYEAFSETLSAKLNEKLFDEIAPSHEKRIQVPDFYDVYDRYFSEAFGKTK